MKTDLLKNNCKVLFSMLICSGFIMSPVDMMAKDNFSTMRIQQENVTVAGTVKDVNGEPIIGANVLVSGSTVGTITDIDGKFSLTAPRDAVLDISYLGYKSQRVKVVSGTPLTVVLKEDSEQLDEVVVVGFGTQKKVNLTGSVGLAEAEELESRPVTSATQALQGLVPGLQISTNTGEMDKNMNINIRGTGTIGEGSSGSPLVLIDGMEGDLNSVNPQDIESVSVFKGCCCCFYLWFSCSFWCYSCYYKKGKIRKGFYKL